MEIYTIGHSNRTFKEFLEVLEAYKIKILVDIRRFPISKKFPHFNKENLEKALPAIGISYIYLGKELGGFRKGGYQAYMETKEFKEGLEKLLTFALKARTAIMCTEKYFGKCHRRYISNELAKLGYKLIHIFDKTKAYEHKALLGDKLGKL